MTTTETPTMTVRDARRAGYIQLTHPYHPQTEDWQLARVLDDLQRGRVPCVLVQMRALRKVGDWRGVAVWRLSPARIVPRGTNNRKN